MKFGTAAVHAGQEPDPHTGAVIPALSLSTTFKQSAPSVLMAGGFDYSRSGNPTRLAFEKAVAALEQAEYALAFSSGSATTVTVCSLLSAGDHIISVNDVYGGSYRYFTKVLPSTGKSVSFVDMADTSVISTFIKKETKMIWIETPTNPTLRLVDIRKVVEIAKQHNILVVVDGTFLSPYFQKPLTLGADIVVHSVTKYINGHSDCVMGVLATKNQDLFQKLKFLQNSIGAVPSAFDCFLANRGLKTLHLRMKAHGYNAQKVAETLEAHPSIQKVIYPGLPSHPQHALAKSQQEGFGGMVTIFLKKDSDKPLLDTSTKFLQSLHYFTLAESLGGVESLVELPSVMTHASVSPEDRLQLGITDGMVRLSVGIEEVEDLLEDLQQALHKAYQ